MTPEQLDEIEKLRLDATGGKWRHQRWPCQIWEGDGPEAEMCAAIGPIYAKAEQPNREQVYADAKFMEAMSEHALPLVKAVREAREERDKALKDAETQGAMHHRYYWSLLACDEARAFDKDDHQKVLVTLTKERDDVRAEVERLRSAISRFVAQYQWQDGPEIQELKALKEGDR